jgi:hypothetical protein
MPCNRKYAFKQDEVTPLTKGKSPHSYFTRRRLMFKQDPLTVVMAGVRTHRFIDCTRSGKLTPETGATIIDAMSTMVFCLL